MKFSCNKGVVILPCLMGLSMQPLTIQDWTECSWRNNVYNAKFYVKTCVEIGIAIEYT